MDSPLPNLEQIRTVAGLLVLTTLLAWESWKPYFTFFARASRARGQHLVRNLAIGLLNGALIALCFSLLWAKTASWSDAQNFGLLHRMPLPVWTHALAAILLLDLWTYAWHRANHRIPFLWRFHRMHHSDPHMDVTTAHRFHPGEIFMSSALRLPVIALIGTHIWELALYELLLAAIVEFHHANVGLPAPLDRALRVFIVTPDMHKVHHSRIQQETDSNYTSLLSLWDRVFQSFRLRADPKAIEFGVDGWTATQHQQLPGMLATPIRQPTLDIRPPDTTRE